MASITFFIATIGRKTLKNNLRSLFGQFHWEDRIEIFFDGPSFAEVGPEYFAEEQEMYGKNLVMHVLPENLGCFGHSIRNAYQKSFHTDFVYNCDDDDNFYPDVMNEVHHDLAANLGKLLLYKFRNVDGMRWRNQVIEHGNVGTPSGMIPNIPDIMGHWVEAAGGDSSFYIETASKLGMENVVWKELALMRVRPHVYGD